MKTGNIIKMKNLFIALLPIGMYHIVTNRGDTDPRHTDWFRLDAQDSKPFDDIHEPTGRDGFRLHAGIESHGCTTFDIYNQEAMLGWSVLKQILNSTSTTKVQDKRGKQWMNPWAELDDYGTIHVTGKDSITIFKK